MTQSYCDLTHIDLVIVVSSTGKENRKGKCFDKTYFGEALTSLEVYFYCK